MSSSGVRDAQPQTMYKTIQHLIDQYGSVDNYVREIGISDQEIAQLRETLCKPGQVPNEPAATEYNEANKGVGFQARH